MSSTLNETKVNMTFALGPENESTQVEILTARFYSAMPSPELELSGTVWNARKEPWSLTVLVDFAGVWLVEAVSPWLKVGKRSSDRFTICTEDNTTGSDRTGTVRLTVPGIDTPVVVTVNQSGTATPSLGFVPQAIEFSKDGPSDGVSVQYNCHPSDRWQVLIQNDWTYVSPMQGRGPAVLKVKAASNKTGAPRASKVVVANKWRRSALQVSQSNLNPNPTISANPNAIVVENGAAINQQVTVTSSSSWTVSHATDWITATKAEGKVQVTAAALPAGSTERSGTVTLITTAPDVAVQAQVIINVTQKPAAPEPAV